MDENKPAYYAVIPASVRYDKDLRPNAKLLYGEITALCNVKGYCWAGNEYFAALFELSPKTVSTLVSSLAKAGYITVELVRSKKTNEVEQRKIFIENLKQNECSPVLEIEHTSPQNRAYPPLEIEEIYIRKNNTRDNNRNFAPKDVLDKFKEYANDNPKLTESLDAFIEFRSKSKHGRVSTPRIADGIINKLEEVAAGNDDFKIALLDYNAVLGYALPFPPLRHWPASWPTEWKRQAEKADCNTNANNSDKQDTVLETEVIDIWE